MNQRYKYIIRPFPETQSHQSEIIFTIFGIMNLRKSRLKMRNPQRFCILKMMLKELNLEERFLILRIQRALLKKTMKSLNTPA